MKINYQNLYNLIYYRNALVDMPGHACDLRGKINGTIKKQKNTIEKKNFTIKKGKNTIKNLLAFKVGGLDIITLTNL